MNAFVSLDMVFFTRIVLTFLHFLWQGGAIAVVVSLGMLMFGLRRSSALVRYGIFLAAMLLMSLCPIVTFFCIRLPESALMHREQDTAMRIATAALTRSEDIITEEATIRKASIPNGQTETVNGYGLSLESAEDSQRRTGSILPASRIWNRWQWMVSYLTAAYFAGAVLLLCRLLLGIDGGRRLRRQSYAIDDRAWKSAIQQVAAALRMGPPPKLLCCRQIAVPTVVGLFRPVILLPLSITSGLTHDQIVAILTHELAHIRRYDHLVNLLQRLVEAMLFFHPAVWWVSRRIRIEREHCCDDVVLRQGTEAIWYAELLVQIAEHNQRSSLMPDVRVIATLQATAGQSQVSQRVRRLLGVPVAETFRLSRSALLGVIATGAVLFTILFSVPVIPGPALAMGDNHKNEENTKTPRETVAEFLKLIKDGRNRDAFALTTPDAHAGWSRALLRLKQFDRIRPFHLVFSESKAIVVSDQYADDNGRDEVFYAELHRHDDRWLIFRHERGTLREASLVVEGFAMNSGVQFDVIPQELVGRWHVNVCHYSITLNSDGTGTALSTGPSGPEPGAVPDPLTWKVQGNQLTIKSAGETRQQRIEWIDSDEARMVSLADCSFEAWARAGKAPREEPVLKRSLSLDENQPFVDLVTGKMYAAPVGIPLEVPVVIANDQVDMPNALQLWAERQGATLGLVDYDGQPYLQFYRQHAYPISDAEEANRLWETATAESIREQFRLGGFGALPFEAYFQIPLDADTLPQTWRLAGIGFLRVESMTGKGTPVVNLHLKMLPPGTNAEASNETGKLERHDNTAASNEDRSEHLDDTLSADDLRFGRTVDIRTGSSDEGKFTFFDFDSDLAAHPPFALTFDGKTPARNVTTLQITDELGTWIERNNIDAVIETEPDRVGLRALRMKGAMHEVNGTAAPRRPTRFNELTAKEVARAFSPRAGAARPALFSFVIEPAPTGTPETRLIQTDKGASGVLEVTGLVNDTGLTDARVRWKLINDPQLLTNWGEAVDGVQVSLRAKQMKWKDGNPPEFLADIRNQGKRNLRADLNTNSCELEVNGQWYRSALFTGSYPAEFPPGSSHSDISIPVDQLWIHYGSSRIEHPGLAPGKHRIRVAFRFEGSGTDAAPAEVVRAVSNEVEIEIVETP